MIPDFLQPRWLRLTLGAGLTLFAWLIWSAGAYQIEGAEHISIGLLILSMLPGAILLGSLLFDFVGSDPEQDDYSPEAVQARIAARDEAERSS